MFKTMFYTIVLVVMIKGIAMGGEYRTFRFEKDTHKDCTEGESVVIYEKILPDGRVAVVESRLWWEEREPPEEIPTIEGHTYAGTLDRMHQHATLRVRDENEESEVIVWEKKLTNSLMRGKVYFGRHESHFYLKVHDIAVMGDRMAIVFSTGDTEIEVIQRNEDNRYEVIYQETLYSYSAASSHSPKQTAFAEIVWPETTTFPGLGLRHPWPNNTLYVLVFRGSGVHIWQINIHEKSSKMIFPVVPD